MKFSVYEDGTPVPEGVNGAGIPFSKCHCFDTTTSVCHYCGMPADEFAVDNRKTCQRPMQPLGGHVDYVGKLLVAVATVKLGGSLISTQQSKELR